MTDLDARLAEVEARLAALEGRPPAREAADAPESGVVGYEGTVRLHGEVQWRIELTPAAVLDLPVGASARVLAALGNPVRLVLVRLLLDGPATAAELQKAAGLSSTGALYHHLGALSGARVVEQADGRYRVPATGVVPLLVALLAAADIAGELR